MNDNDLIIFYHFYTHVSHRFNSVRKRTTANAIRKWIDTRHHLYSNQFLFLLAFIDKKGKVKTSMLLRFCHFVIGNLQWVSINFVQTKNSWKLTAHSMNSIQVLMSLWAKTQMKATKFKLFFDHMWIFWGQKLFRVFVLCCALSTNLLTSYFHVVNLCRPRKSFFFPYVNDMKWK